ncbi:hypothetical protein AB0M46_18725 [Dactylosporangium sp. NPDC051485]
MRRQLVTCAAGRTGPHRVRRDVKGTRMLKTCLPGEQPGDRP